jgi:apolipoprotein N-acyltransferase
VLRFLLVFIGGLAMGLSPAPTSLYYLAWVALVPLWIATVREKYRENILIMALLWGFGYHGTALFWITGIHPMTWMGVPWLASLAIAVFCWLFITCWGTAIVLLWCTGMFYLGKELPAAARIFLGVAFWCILEALWSHTPLWWSTVAYTQSPHNLPILQLGQFSGFTTITAVIILINGCIAEAFILGKWKADSNNSKPAHIDSRKLLITSILLLFSFHLWGLYLYRQPLERVADQAVNIGIIQGNIPNTIKLYPEGFKRAIDGYTKGYRLLARREADIVLTPETALPFYWPDIVAQGSFYGAILQEKVPAWVGAFGREGKSYTNSLFTVDGKGKVMSRYDKVKLVPLGEYIPFEPILGRFIDRLSPLDAHLIAGQSGQIVHTPFGIVTVGICYESAYPEHFRGQTLAGGELIITASNNAHYSRAMPAQHHAQDVMRAIENDRWMARATNTGYSAFVNPRGDTIWISGINTYELHQERVYRRQTKTLYVRWGDWLTKSLSLGVVMILLGYKKTLT